MRKEFRCAVTVKINTETSHHCNFEQWLTKNCKPKPSNLFCLEARKVNYGVCSPWFVPGLSFHFVSAPLQWHSNLHPALVKTEIIFRSAFYCRQTYDIFLGKGEETRMKQTWRHEAHHQQRHSSTPYQLHLSHNCTIIAKISSSVLKLIPMNLYVGAFSAY